MLLLHCRKLLVVPALYINLIVLLLHCIKLLVVSALIVLLLHCIKLLAVSALYKAYSVTVTLYKAAGSVCTV